MSFSALNTMTVNNRSKFSNDFKISMNFNYSLKNHNWFNIGGKTKVFFKAETLNDLCKFMRFFREKINFFL